MERFSEILPRLLVSYKYTTTMPIVTREASYFLESVSSKAADFCTGKLELHVAPFYKLKDKNLFYWQPILDFDPENLSEWNLYKRTVEVLTKGFEELFYVELTGRGFHLVADFALGPYSAQEAAQIRSCLRKKVKHADVIASVRFMPVRRYPSKAREKGWVVHLPLREFKTLSRTEADLLKLKRHPPCIPSKLKRELLTKVLPKKMLGRGKAKEGVLPSWIAKCP